MHDKEMKNKVFIISHTTGKAGGLYNLELYLRSIGYNFFELLHPLDDYSKVNTTFKDLRNNVTTIERQNIGIRNYVIDFVQSVKYLRKHRFEIFIGCSNFDTLPAVFCRRILRINIPKIIYYPRDYSENRFGKKILDTLYVLIEKIVIRNADQIVSNTKRAEAKREELGMNLSKSVVIPNPIHLENLVFKPKHVDKHSFIYVGDVSKEHGLHDMVTVLTEYIKKLVIIGDGDDWERTVAYAKKQKFELEIHHKKSRDFVTKYLQEFHGVGLAPYNQFSRWTYYCSPLKVVEYVSCGIPVILSSVPEVSETIRSKKLGVIYDELNSSEIIAKLEAMDTENFYERAKTFYQENSTAERLKDLSL